MLTINSIGDIAMCQQSWLHEDSNPLLHFSSDLYREVERVGERGQMQPYKRVTTKNAEVSTSSGSSLEIVTQQKPTNQFSFQKLI